MSDIFHLKSITHAHSVMGLPPPKHPLISFFYHNDPHLRIIEGDIRFSANLYLIGMKDGVTGSPAYGQNSYDFEEGTMIFVQPQQVLEGGAFEVAEDSQGWTLLFHPDLIRPYELNTQIRSYSYFSYETNEALHLSQDEKEELTALALKIEKEYNQNIDKHTEELMVVNLTSILKYCKRYYDRQFYTRSSLNKGHIAKFEEFLEEYFNTEQHLEKGLPTVQQCGKALNMSGHYLSDLLKIETGKGITEHVHLFVIEQAKTQLLISQKTVSEIAYALGFEYPQNFSRLFKSRTGLSPRAFRQGK
jgi:AraC-like DNA-binding protein